MKDGKKAGQLEEEGPALDGSHIRAKPPDPQDPLSPEEVVPELQRRKEEEEQNRVTKRGPAREPGTDQGSRKPSKEELRDTSNKTCKGCWVTFGDRKPFIQHCRLEHGRRFKAKRGPSLPPPSHQGPPAHLHPLKGSPRTTQHASSPDTKRKRPGKPAPEVTG